MLSVAIEQNESLTAFANSVTHNLRSYFGNWVFLKKILII